MIQTLEMVAARLGAWIAADPQHAEWWTAAGMGLVIACFALLSFEQLKARASAKQN